MASMTHQLESPASLESPRVRLEPVPFYHTLLDGTWWPRSGDLTAELCALVPVLDHVRGPVNRLLLSAAGWTTRPHQITAAGHTVSVGYLAAQPPSMMTVLCADGGMCMLRVAPNEGDPGRDEDVREKDEGGFGPRRERRDRG